MARWKAQYGPDPQSEHYDLNLQADIYLSIHYDRPTNCIAEDKSNAQTRWYCDALQQKWIAHEVSRGLPHIYRSYKQKVKDRGTIIKRNYPQHRYEPWLFFKAPIEAIMNWRGPWEHQYFNPWGANHVNIHRREWPDAPEAHLPNHCWIQKRLIFGGSLGYGWDNWYCYSDDCRALREVSYFFWDERTRTNTTDADQFAEDEHDEISGQESEAEGETDADDRSDHPSANEVSSAPPMPSQQLDNLYMIRKQVRYLEQVSSRLY